MRYSLNTRRIFTDTNPAGGVKGNGGRDKMKGTIIGAIIVLVLLLILAAVIYGIYRKISRTVKGYSRMLFGTEDVREGVQKMEREYAATPKSVSSATGLYLPEIMKDFPEFHLEEMKSRVKNVLISYLRSVDSGNSRLLTEGTQQLKDKLDMRIEMLRSAGLREHYEQIKVHKTEIYQYRREKGRCSIVFQTAAGHIHYQEQGGSVVRGRRDRLEQAKYNVEVSYIQDLEQVENISDMGLAMVCPNCGAPLPALGAKTCAYCDSPVRELNLKAWNFTSVEPVDG